MIQDFCMNSTSPIVETKAGKLRGFHYDGVDHFYGIRYAKAKRFQMPEPVKPWEGVKDAGSYGMICPVLNDPMPTGEVQTPHRFWPQSEHCQYLNVWTTACDPAAKKPDAGKKPEDDKPLAIDPATGGHSLNAHADVHTLGKPPPAKDDKPSLADEAEKATK